MKKTLIACGLLLAACGDRDSRWDAHIESPISHGLSGSVALYDPPLDRFLMVTSPAADQLQVKSLPVGKNVAEVALSADKRLLFVLSRGEQPRYRPEDERPRLTVIDGDTTPDLARTPFELDDPLQRLAVDPRGEWVAAYQSDSTVINPNELVLCSLAKGNERCVPKTVRSFGGVPLELVFTDPLTLPSGNARRFLIVRTDRDITLIDLADLTRSEITVRLPETADKKASVPAQVVYTKGDPAQDTNARLAVRLANQADVVILDFGPSSSAAREFTITPNIVDAGGVPSAIDFVRTEGGLRLAALVPQRRRATLVDPATTATEVVDFPVAYSHMTRITDSVAATPEGGDVALLWSESNEGIAFWSLGSTSNTPYRSVDANDIDMAVNQVIDVPAPNRHIKLLASAHSDRFYVLDLEKRQTFPMLTSSGGFRVTVSPDGRRLWAFRPGSGQFSSVELSDLHPSSLSVRQGVTQVHDVERADGGRAALVLHGTRIDGAYQYSSNVAVTLLDALAPDSAHSRYFGGLYLEGL